MRAYVFKKKWKHWLAGLFDFFGYVVTFFVPRDFLFDASSVKRILLIRIDHLGDSLLLRPAIQALRKARPGLQIHLLTTPENQPVFLADPFLDKVIPFPGHWFQKKMSFLKQISAFWAMVGNIRLENYDAAIDFRGDVRGNALMWAAGIPIRMGYGMTGGGWMLTHEKNQASNKHQAELNCEMLKEWIGTELSAKNPPVSYPANTFSRLHGKISNLRWPYAVVHMGAGNPAKEWPFECFAELMEKLIQSGMVKTIFLAGTAEEREKAPAPKQDSIIDLRGLTDLQELACLLEGAAFFIGNDSGPAHLAAAQGIPVIVLASRTNDIKTWHPWTKKLCILSATSGEVISVEKAESGVLSLISQGT